MDESVGIASHSSMYSRTVLQKNGLYSFFDPAGFAFIPSDIHSQAEYAEKQILIRKRGERVPTILSQRSILLQKSSIFDGDDCGAEPTCLLAHGESNQYMGSMLNGPELKDELTRTVRDEWSSIVWPAQGNIHKREDLKTEIRIAVNNVMQLLVEKDHMVNASPRAVDYGDFIIPGSSGFYQSTLEGSTSDHLRCILSDLGTDTTDAIVIDPPWTSKSASRRCMYKTLSLTEIGSGLYPFRNLLQRNGIVAIWVTNDPKICQFVLSDFFNSWGVSPIAQWVWVKLTSSNEPVIPFSNTARKTYERVLVGVKSELKYDFSLKKIDRFIFSEPCALHSFKPPLDFYIDELLPHKKHRPARVELFARILRKDYVSWGDQVLLCNHKSLYISPGCC